MRPESLGASQMKKLILMVSLLVLCAASRVSAVDVVMWNFSDLNGTFDSSPPTGFAVSALTAVNSSIAFNATSPSSGYTGATGGGNAAVSAVLGGFNVSTSTYYTFTLTPNAGFSIDTTAFSFGSRSTASGPVLLTLRSSVDGFSTDVASAVAANDSSWSLFSFVINVSGHTDTAVEFRLYGSGGSATASNWRIDDLSVTATAIPEPATYMLFGVGLLACAQRFRRSKNRK